MTIKFGELRKYLSRVDRLSICFEDGHYDNYTMLADIPEGKYDEYYVFGVGMADVEFALDVYGEPIEMPEKISSKDGFFLGCGLEVALTQEAGEIKRVDDKTLRFGDLRGYLQIGRFFSVVIKEGWTGEHFEWKDEIPESYDDMYVYGIGMEDNPEEVRELMKYGRSIIDTVPAKRMKIVVSERPKELSYDKGKSD